MATITIPLPEDRLIKLNAMAAALRIPTEELIRAGIEDLMAQPDDSFERAARRTLEKNSELYRRLA